MEHISRVQAARPSAETPPPARSAEFSQALKNWLAVFSEHYRQEISDLAAVGYLEGLADLTAGQLNLACAEALRTCRFLPTAADIRAALGDARNKLSEPLRRGEAETERDTCAECQGLGWRIVPRGDGAGNWAVRCGCWEARKESAAETPR
jgi:hypothetical protein